MKYKSELLDISVLTINHHMDVMAVVVIKMETTHVTKPILIIILLSFFLFSSSTPYKFNQWGCDDVMKFEENVAKSRIGTRPTLFLSTKGSCCCTHVTYCALRKLYNGEHTSFLTFYKGTL